MNWAAAAEAWISFLNDVERARHRLQCSALTAWFRGHTNSSDYRLLPALFRFTDSVDPEFRQEAASIATEDTALKGSFDNLLKEKRILRQSLCAAKTSGDLGAMERLNAESREIRRRLGEVKQKRDRTAQRMRPINLVHVGERESFIEYSFRSGSPSNSSWQVLAEMQHHGVPTRLLDWSENLATALFFALREYREALDVHWKEARRRHKEAKRSNDTRSSTPDSLSPFYVPQITSVPSIWIMNPYRASEEATGRIRIWDLTLEPKFDYFQKFVADREWHFEKPIPMYSPWKNPRIAAQQGMFVVFGYRRDPIDRQFSKTVALEVRIPPLAAVYGAKHLRDFLGLDHFSLFRDNTALADKVTETYLRV